MARKAKMVTRTVKAKEVTVLCLNTVTAEPFNDTVTIFGNYKTEDKLMKAVSARLDTDEVKAVKIVAVNDINTLYGMTEDTFIANAHPITRKGDN